MSGLNVFTGQLETVSLQPPNMRSCTNTDLLEYFENAYSLEEWLFSSFTSEEFLYKYPDHLRLPLIFYYGHTPAFYINKLMLTPFLKTRVNSKFETMFETGVDEMAWDDTENYRMGGTLDWPTLDEVVEYRRQVRKVVRDVITSNKLASPIAPDSPWWALWMMIDHQRIHFELNTVLVRQMPLEMVKKPKGWKYAPLHADVSVKENPMIAQSGRTVRLGKDTNFPTFGWDVEYGNMILDVPDFETSQYLVTNSEMLKFVLDGGYEQRKFWSDEGWKWKESQKAKHPSFWVCDKQCKSNCGGDLTNFSHCCITREELSTDQIYLYRAMFDVIELPMDWPAETNYHEANAFCAWKGSGFRLPTEAELNILQSLSSPDIQNPQTDPIYSENIKECYNLNLAYGSPTPVNLYPPSATGCFDVMGNVWNWLEDHFNGLSGFKSSIYYDDYTTNSANSEHTLLMAGCWASSGAFASRFYRNGFRRHFFQHAGFRLCKSLKQDSPVKFVPPTPKGVLEAMSAAGLKPISNDSCNKQFNDESDEFLTKIVFDQFKTNNSRSNPTLDPVIKYLNDLASNECDKRKESKQRVLVVGCGPGRLAFDLSKKFEVVGCDTSHRCIKFASELLKRKSLAANGKEQISKRRKLSSDKQKVLPPVFDPENITFKQLSWIPCELKNFHLVINMFLDRANNPRAWIARLSELVGQTDNGRCVIVSKKFTSQLLLNDLKLNDLQLVSEDQVPDSSDVVHHITTWKKN